MTQYGSIPGVQITTESGTVAGVTIGTEQYHILVGTGAPGGSGSASANEVVNIEGVGDAEDHFGDGSDIANAYDRSTNNGASTDYVVGVRADVTEEVETVSDTSNPLAEAPILANENRVDVVADPGGSDTSHDVTFEFDDTLSTPGTDETIINPYSGELETDASADIEVTYDWADWSAAFEAAGDYMGEGEFGVITPLTAAHDVATDLDGTLTTIREDELKLAVGVMPAEYNATATDGAPKIDAAGYTAQMSSDVMFKAAPTYIDGGNAKDRYVGAIGAVAGRFAGTPTTEPVYDDTITVDGLYQGLTRADKTDLRDQYIIPVRDTGTVRIADNHSTYDQATDGGWTRDYFTRRIVDLTAITMRRVARRQIGGVLTGGVVSDVDEVVTEELRELANDGLLVPGGQEVETFRENDTTIGIDLDITPFGVTKAADVTIAIDA